MTGLLLAQLPDDANTAQMPMRGDLVPPDAGRVARPRPLMRPLWRLAAALYAAVALASLCWPLAIWWLLA